jgi:hypothetical protein
MDETLVLLAKEVRGRTLRLIDGLTDADASFAAPGLKNTILWHAGHALVVVEHLSLAPLHGGTLEYPAGYHEVFSWKSDPTTVKRWPEIAEVRGLLVAQLERLTSALARTSQEQLSTIIDPQRGRTLRFSVLHGLHDEAGHQGEIWVLKKLLARAT